ncbi:hypothetical protein EWM64_g10806 [Hericium alpestre]|uniref:Uncharacterized protein n=1 Tax=Hericium alpestre TaxID=135208 RepID=A0A4Y9ZEH5_9AGAM|nr:hypothetical protein EWM64_g10806 [Hericium alpestre]
MLPFTLPLDVDEDQRMPSSALCLLMTAVDTVGKHLDWPTVDFITDRTNLRNLVKWIGGDTKQRNDFRIDMELVGDHTVLFDMSHTGWNGGGRTNYGHSFERGTTVPAPGCERSSGHYRIIKYDFFGFTMVVRFEVDACLSPGKGAAELHILEDSLSTPIVSPGVTICQGLRIIRAGSEVSQESLVELKTCREIRNCVQWSQVFPQLYLSGTPWLHAGFHENGTFSRVETRNMVEMQEQRSNFEPRLQQLGQTLKTIQELAVTHGKNTRLSLVLQDRRLSVYKRASKESFLSKEPTNPTFETIKLIFQRAELVFQYANPSFQRANPGFQRANPTYQSANSTY